MKPIKLTPYQSIFYYEWLNNPNRSDYNIVIDNTVTGKLDLQRYNDSFEQLLNEHFITRHVIKDTENGLCWKLVEPTVNLTVFHDKPLSDEQIYSLVTEPFDLHNGPLVRVHLINTADECYRMIFIFHHIVVDGISTEEIWDKWRKLYNGVTYQTPSLAEQAIMHQNLYQYFDRVLADNKNQMLAFWQKHLKNLSGLDLSFLKSNHTKLEAKQLSSLSEYLFSYDKDIVKQVNGLRRQYKLTPYLFGQLVMATLLSKMSGNDAVALAYPIAILEGKELLYGAHINTLIIDYRFDESTTLDSLINQTLAFYKELKTSHAKYLPINEIIRCGGDSSLLNVAFAQTFYRDHEVGLNGVKNQSVNHTFQVDLASTLLFEQQEHNNQINYRVRFDSHVLDERLVKNFIAIYQKLFIDMLESLTSGFKSRAIKDIELVDSKKYLATLISNPIEQTPSNVIFQFEKIVRQFPERIAIIYNDKKLTYQQLNQLSNQLARYLISTFKLETDDLIALCIEKSEWMPVCILAILKAGAAYVPLDTRAPKQRLAYILKDTKAKVILTTSIVNDSFESVITASSIAPIIIDSIEFQACLATYQQENLNIPLSPNQLAYVIYTSGTTGQPKGVMIEHKGLINLAIVQASEFGLAVTADLIKNSLWYASYVFDAHVSELFTTIVNGHCLHILAEDKRLDFNLLAYYIRSVGVQIATIPPALLTKDQLLPLETLVVAGESCNIEIMERYSQQGTHVINAYGPTESTVCATLHHYQLGDNSLNIGLPLTNIAVYILDKDLKPLPIGAIGDLYVSGIGLARGYLNNPTQTAQAFIINPFVDENSGQALLYKTGDLARQMPNGCIEYAGRKDFQVKIRGFRIELAEIENCLSQIPQINRSVVVAHTLSSGLKTLVAYYSAEESLNDTDILQYLRNYLPDYMLPSLLIHLADFPLTVNGKINKTALPSPNFTQQAHYSAPTNEIEATLCQIFADVLGVDKVGVDDDFLALGGDSISGILLVSKVRHKLNAILSIKDLFAHKTPRLLVSTINAGTAEQSTAIVAEKGELSGAFKLLPIQQWFFNCVEQGLFLDYQHWNQSFVLEVPRLDITVLQQSLKLLVSYHDALRLIFVRDDKGIYTQNYCKKIESIPFESVNLTRREAIEKQLFNQWQLGFDIHHGPLFHIAYVESDSWTHAKLHFAFHHLIVDTVSWHIIKQDLQKIYHLLATKPHSNDSVEDILGEKPSSYRQWVANIQDYTNHCDINDEEAYWHQTIQALQEYRQQLTPLFVHKKLNETLLTLDKTYTTKLQNNQIHAVLSTQINDILLANLVIIIKQFTGIEQHCITLEGHGRELLSTRFDINRTVGWFTNMYPISLIANAETLTHIANVKDTLAQTSQRSIGFGPLFGYQADKLSPISFNYLGQFDETSKRNWQFVFTDTGTTMSAKNSTPNWLSIDCGIVDGELKIKFKGYLDSATINKLSEKYIDRLKNTIDQLSNVNRHYLTTADIDYVVSSHQLARLQEAAEVESIYLANSLQEGFIYHAIKQGNTDDAYRVQMFWEYRNILDVGLLKKAWQLVQTNYACLRLRFNWDEELIQIIDKTAPLHWSYYDISDQSLQQQQSFLEKLHKQDRNQPYDLSASGLFRVYLVKYNEHHYRCIFSSHHAILDGWSNPILIKAVHDIYLSLLMDGEVVLNIDQSYQKAQHYLQKNRTEHLNYWQHYLGKQQTKEDLSLLLADSVRGVQLGSYKYITTPAQKTLIIESDLYLALKEMSAQYGVTANAILQYCWHKVLSVYTGSNDTIVGMVVAGRNLPIEGIEKAVGLLINTVPLIVDHQESTSLLAVIQTLQHDIHEANSRSHINLAMLQQSGERLFNSLFVFENYPIPESHFGDALTLNFTGAEEKQDYPLVITVLDRCQKLTLTLCYAGELFEEDLVGNLLSTIKQILIQVVNDPQVQHNKINYLNEQQYQRVIYDWNDTGCDYCADKTIVSLFEQQVELLSNHPAIIFNDITLTYQQLNQKVNQLAHYLKSVYQLHPNDFVGLYLERSEKIIISILAVLKAGAAYVPMDPTAPDERNQFIITDAKTKVVISEQACFAKINQCISDILVIDLPEVIEALSQRQIANPITINKSSDLAYCIYTSGTTGKPKGSLINHRNINRLVIHQNYTEITQNDRLLAISGYQFDASIYDIFGSLLHGASLVIAEKQSLLDLNYFNQLLIDQGITHFFTPTVFFNTLADAQLTQLAHINYIFVGGEALSVSHINEFRKRYPNVKLSNVYGPTETTTYTTAFLTNTASVEFNATVPIGRPINNTTLYILNGELKPVPIGAVGELYIGGAGVGLGYLNNPALTAKAFIQNPFQTKIENKHGYNATIYKTGDLVRYLADGNVEYLGRNDSQVKIRGFRIELGEIEACLIKYPTIKQALVIAIDNVQADKQLFAYYIAEQAIAREELIDYLVQTLPEYMIPAAFIYLKAFPLTINDKIDRKALPVVAFENTASHIAPTSITEQQVTKIYSNLLALNSNDISITDDFFRLGGNSILAIKLASRLSVYFDKTIHVADIFNYKTIRSLSQYIDQLTNQQLAISIANVQHIEEQCLSYAQERLWFIDRFAGGSDAYNIPLTLILKPQVSLATLAEALTKIIERHEILRTVIKINDKGDGYQQVLAIDAIKLTVNAKHCKNAHELNDDLRQHAHKIFDLSTEIPISVQAYYLDQQSYLSIVIHHIAFDGWSIDLFSKELTHYYRFYSEPDVLADLPCITIQYKDFALWQRRYLQGERLQSQMEYWQRKLQDYQPLNLATDYKRPLAIDYRGADIHFSLTKETSQHLRQLAAHLEVSLYTVLLSGYFLLLKAYSNQSDIIVGTPIAGRHYPGIENTLGFFVNTLVLRRQINDQESLAQFIQSTGLLLAEAQTCQDLPFEKLVDALQVEKDSSRHPLFQVMFGMQSFGVIDEADSKQLFTPYQSENIAYRVAKFDLSTLLDDSKEVIEGGVNYATALFKASTIECYISAYCYILEQLSDLVWQKQAISQLRYLNKQQFQTIIYDWNKSDSEYYADKTVIDLFEQQVRESAHHPAVIFNSVTLTYQQLNQRANQLAHYLLAHYNLKPNDLVGLYLERSEKIVVSILAILKAGAAYVPMDTNAPDERNHFISTDADIKLVITEQVHAAKVDQFTTQVISLDQTDTVEALVEQATQNPATSTQSKNLAYCIYTSGTTGKPKGTLVTHRNINRLAINPNYTHITPEDRLLAISGYQFDASTYDIFVTLLNGASVVIAEKNVFLDLARLNQLLDEKKITNCFITTAFFNTLVDAMLPNLTCLNYVLVGGEALSTYHVNRFRRLYPDVKLVNVYGPTETTTYAMSFLINTVRAEFNHSIPIGRPISNTTAYILDSTHRPVPVGAIGELYIGGAGVGLGYLNNAQLTDNVFIHNPFQNKAQQAQNYNDRLYKTGDLVRFLNDGNIEYIGRNDFQVKIRGFRVELAEIETCLIKYPEINQALVIARDNVQGNKQLIAYYVASQPISSDWLFDYLKQYLPEYMIPAAFIHLEALPLTLNGKVNIAALPAATVNISAKYIAPNTQTEQKIALLYAELLGINFETISVMDDFFRLGGNSILAIKLASRLSDSTRKMVHVADIFNYKTVGELSQFIDTLAESQYRIVPQTVGCEEQQLLSFAQERLWFIDGYAGGTDAYNIPLILIANPQLSLLILTKALNKIIKRHEILRTIIKTNSAGEGYQQVLAVEDAKVSITNKSCQCINELNNAITEHVHKVFNLATEIPLSVKSYQLNEQTYLSLVIHHIAFDGWSIELLLKELNYYYQWFSASEVLPELPEVSVQYKDFALWQRQYLQGEQLQLQLSYWQEKLTGYQPLNLPTDYLRPREIDYHGADINFNLTKETSQNLRQLAANLNVSLYTVLLSGYYLLLKAYSNQSDIVLGTPIAGRHYLGIENTMGFFVNTLALRREIDDQVSLVEFIQTTGKLLSEAQRYQDLPFEKLVDALTVNKDASRHPIFQVMFGVQSFGSSSSQAVESLFTPYQADTLQYHIAKFDLTTILDDSQETITGHFNYAKALFKHETIIGYMDVYSHILDQFSELSQKQLPMSHLSYLNDLTYNKIVYQWNQTQHAFPRDKTLAEMFEEQVVKTPNNMAVIYENNHLTYQQLNEKSNQLAHYLKNQFAIQGDDLVGICLDKTEQIIISMLAILKSGGAYVPLSPKLPDERKQWIIEDTHCKAVITSSEYEASLNKILSDKATGLVSINTLNRHSDVSRHNIVTMTTAKHLAYIIYTSGTTGKPKGVMIEQCSVVNASFVQRKAMGLEVCDANMVAKHTLWYSDYTFDAHALDIFTPLLTGNCVHIFAQDKRLDLQALINYVTTNRIDYAFIPPILLDKNKIIPIPRILLGGEGISQHIIDYYATQQRQLINGYGPTEATVWATYRIYRQGDLNSNIGKPIYNATVYILDSLLRPVPIGALGELYIGGVGVGRGYLNNFELTNKVFINNPFQTKDQKKEGKNSRLYKTGDIVRYLADGNIEYIGRNDFQVKIRGFRIELAEIEVRLIKYPAIKQALVLARDNNRGDKQLIAYYVAEQPIEHNELFEYLKQSLPEYMIPVAFIHLTSLPVTLNGKVNRSALPAVNLNSMSQYVPPVTEIEHHVTQLYSELLGIENNKISIIEDFFRLGGNSILAIKLATKLSEQTGKAVHIADIFNYKTIQSLSQYIETMTNYQTLITVSEVHRVQDQRLSFAQERLWFIDSYGGGSSAYNVPLVLALKKQVSLAVLNKALNKIVLRHEILRTLITADADGIGYQYVLEPENAYVTINHRLCQDEAMLNQQITTHINQVFDLASQIPLSAQSYQLNESTYFSLVIHHIAFDGWSVDLLLRELNHYYHFFSVNDSKPELPAVSVQYKDFALWQRQYLQGGQLQTQLDYWCSKLVDYQGLNLPIDYLRPMQVDYQGADIGFSLTLETSQQLRQLAASLNVSLYTVLLSGYYLLLSIYSNQSDILIGTPIAGRQYSGIENTIGFFVNTLVLRCEIESQQSLADFIKATGVFLSEAQQYQDLPFEKLVDALQIEKDPSRHPLFQVMFGLQSFGSANEQSIESLFVPYQTSAIQYSAAKFDLSTMLDDSQETIRGNFNYASALFKAETIEGYINVYCYILEQLSNLILQNKSVSQLRYLDEFNFNKLIHQWNQTRQDYPYDKTIYQMFEAQVTRTPDNIAVIYEEDQLTYRELNEKANQLAGYLRDKFMIEADNLVALCLDRSLTMAIAILGILKSGAAYVPIDPLAPADRSRYILENTKVKVILTVNSCYDRCLMLVEGDQAIVNLQAAAMVKQLSNYAYDNLSPLANANNLAYVIYTSGTTGNPKGVMLEHKNVVNRIVWGQNQYPITEQDRILQKTNYAFDVSVWELFWANWYGACTVFAHSEQYKDNVYLAELIDSKKITVIHFVPSMLVVFVDALAAHLVLQTKLQKLKYLFCSGEELNVYEVKQCHKLLPNCQIHNLYGPTETTVEVLYYDCNQRDLTQVFIGRPIANSTAYILNEQLQPIPIGGIGELYIGGDGVGRGYLYNSILSNQRFITNPFQTEQEKYQNYNGRIYKTGDVARYRYDGNIEYLGRNDFQVKIRGYRIELKEIEACLITHPEINHAVVIAYERPDKDKYLVAYYVANDVLDEGMMINHLRQTLPEYMLPIAFVHLATLPVTSNGKLDRKQLPIPAINHTVEHVLPSSEIEKILMDIFADTLSISTSEISMTHNFFTLGGNSILAMKLNSRINQLFQIRLSLVDILSANTITALALKIGSMDKLEFNPLITMTAITDKPQIFMIHPGMGGCSVYLSLANRLANHYCCYGVDSYNFYHDNKIEQLDQLANYYLSYIDKVVDLTQPITLLGWSLGGQIALEIASILEARNISNVKVCALDTWLLSPDDLNENIPLKDLGHLMTQLNIPKYLRANVVSVVDVDMKLSLQPLSAKLKKTRVILFKASEEKGFGALYQKYLYNNIDYYLCTSDQLTTIELKTDHYKILEKEQEIIEHLVSFD